MPDLAPQERLQPSLLDRLTDDEPGRRSEARERRVLTEQQLRACILRDLGWLLNTGSLGQCQDLSDFPEVARSVLNYGVRDLAGSTLSSLEREDVEQRLIDAVRTFEPRVLRDSLRVRAVLTQEHMNRKALAFYVEGEVWADPMPLHLFLKTEFDLETGEASVSEATEPPRTRA